MDKYEILELCKNNGIDVSKNISISGTNEMAYELICNLASRYDFISLYPILNRDPIYFYLLIITAFRFIKGMYLFGEELCRELLKGLIKPIFNFDENCLKLGICDPSSEFAIKQKEFIKRIENFNPFSFKEEEISLDNGLIKSLNVYLFRYYNENKEQKELTILENLIKPDFLKNFKVDAPIKKELPYDPVLLWTFPDKDKEAANDKEFERWENECVKANVLFNILFLLTEENKDKVNDYISNNMQNVLSKESFIHENYLGKIPDKILPLLNFQLEKNGDKPYINITNQQKIFDFFWDTKMPKNISADWYSDELQDYIFENHLSFLKRSKSYQLEKIILRNVDKIDNFTDVEDLKIVTELVERALSYTTQQYNNEVNRCIYDKKEFDKVLEVVSKVRMELPEIRNSIQTFTQEQIFDSLYFIDNYFKRVKQKNKKIVHTFNNAIKDNFKDIFIIIKNKKALEKCYKNVKNKTLEIVYAEEVAEMKKIIDEEYKKYLEEIKNSKKYSFEKYYAKVKENLDAETIFYDFVNNRKFSEVFNKIILSYNDKALEIKNLLSSNEYYYSQLQESAEGCELTPLMTCLIKAIEQFMCACIKYAHNNKLCDTNTIVDNNYKYEINNINWIKTKITCTPLKNFIEKNILENKDNYIDEKLKNKIINNLENFIENVRNGHFHKHNLFSLRNIKQYVEDSYEVIKGLIAMFVYFEENKK